MPRYIIFSDLDGTLLDHNTYSWAAARQALDLIKQTKTPLILVSSKTRSEMKAIQEELGVSDPFVVEDGAAVLIKNHHEFGSITGAENFHGYKAIILSKPRDELMEKVRVLKQKFSIKGLSEMSLREIVDLTNLEYDQAASAKVREFGDAFVFTEGGSDADVERLRIESEKLGFTLTRGGRFFHLLAGYDKGLAVKKIIGLYQSVDSSKVSLGIGDSLNDKEMLMEVKKPFLVAKPDGRHENMDIPGLIKVPQIGPGGFNRVVLDLLG